MRLKKKKPEKKLWDKKDKEETTPRYKKTSTTYKKTGTYDNGRLKSFVFVTTHCIERFVEIMPEFEDFPFEKVRGIILAMYRSGCLFGGQLGDDFLILSKNFRTGHKVVFACTTDEHENGDGKITILKTTLTVDHANGNMQQKEMKNPDISLEDMQKEIFNLG